MNRDFSHPIAFFLKRWWILFAALTLGPAPAFAGPDFQALFFWKKEKKQKPVEVPVEQKAGSVRIFETPEYLLLFSIYPITRKVAPDGPREEDSHWNEVGYKLVVRGEEPAKLFGAEDWLEIRFQDKDGFNVVADSVHHEAGKTEYYGFIRVEIPKAKQIRRLEIKPIKPPAPASSPHQEAAEPPKPAPVPVATPAPEVPKQEKPKPVAEGVSEKKSGAEAVPAAEKPAAADAASSPFGPSAVTNEGIQKTLQEVEKKEPTKIEPSPTTLPPAGTAALPPAGPSKENPNKGEK